MPILMTGGDRPLGEAPDKKPLCQSCQLRPSTYNYGAIWICGPCLRASKEREEDDE